MPQEDAACRKRTQHAARGRSMPQEAAACRKRPQHAARGRSMPQQDAACRKRTQHAARGRSMPQEAAACRKRPQHAARGRSMLQEDAACRKRPQHAARGRSMPQEDAACRKRTWSLQEFVCQYDPLILSLPDFSTISELLLLATYSCITPQKRAEHASRALILDANTFSRSCNNISRCAVERNEM